MAISDDALAQVAATLTTSLGNKLAFGEDGPGDVKAVVRIFSEVLKELRVHHAPETPAETIGRSRMVLQRDDD